MYIAHSTCIKIMQNNSTSYSLSITVKTRDSQIHFLQIPRVFDNVKDKLFYLHKRFKYSRPFLFAYAYVDLVYMQSFYPYLSRQRYTYAQMDTDDIADITSHIVPQERRRSDTGFRTSCHRHSMSLLAGRLRIHRSRGRGSCS